MKNPFKKKQPVNPIVSNIVLLYNAKISLLRGQKGMSRHEKQCIAMEHALKNAKKEFV